MKTFYFFLFFICLILSDSNIPLNHEQRMAELEELRKERHKNLDNYKADIEKIKQRADSIRNSRGHGHKPMPQLKCDFDNIEDCKAVCSNENNCRTCINYEKSSAGFRCDNEN